MFRISRIPGAFPFRGVALFAFAVAYALPGLVGHDPWKTDDAIHFGITYAMLENGRWWMPSLAGQTLIGVAPLYYWIAAGCAHLFGGILPLHDAARLASGVVLAVYLVGMAHAARRLYGESAGPVSVLLAIGSLGLLVHSHDAQPWTLFLAGIVWTVAGLAEASARPWRGWCTAGISAGFSMLAVGPLAALALLPIVLVMAARAALTRGPAALLHGVLALALACLPVAVWSAVLYNIDARLQSAWAVALLDQARGWSLDPHNLFAYVRLLPWFAWPAIPLALWRVWVARRELGQLGIALPALASVVLLVAMASAEPARSLSTLPLLPPIVLLAVPAAESLRRGAANAFDWFAVMTFAAAGALVWLGWVAMLSGWPPRIARNFAKLEPGFALSFSPVAFALACAVSLLWLWVAVAAPRVPIRGTVTWAAGTTALWCLVSTLWLPWIDYGKSYRSMTASLARALPEHYRCIQRIDLGAAQRASLDYFQRVRTVAGEGSRCDLMLTQETGRHPRGNPTGWTKIWEGRRSGDRNEIFRLYKRGSP